MSENEKSSPALAASSILVAPSCEKKVKGGLIFEAIPAIMGELQAVGRERKNQQQGFNYRGIDDLYNALQPLLAKHKVFTVPEVLDAKRTERASRSGSALFHVILRMKFTFFAGDGSSVEAVVEGEGMDSGDKGTNKAESIAHKYALTQVFAVRTEDQPDPDGETHDVKAKPTKDARQPETNLSHKNPPPSAPKPTAVTKKPAAGEGDNQDEARAKRLGFSSAKAHTAALKVLYTVADKNKWTKAMVKKAMMSDELNVTSSLELTFKQYQDLLSHIKAHPMPPPEDA